jgi:hypothetical protein
MVHPEQSHAGVLDTRRTGGAIVPLSAAHYPGSLRAAHLAASSGAAAILVAETGAGEVARAVSACKTRAPVLVFCSRCAHTLGNRLVLALGGPLQYPRARWGAGLRPQYPYTKSPAHPRTLCSHSHAPSTH